VVEAAKKNGIRIIAIDSDAAYQWSGINTEKRIKTINMCAYTQFNQQDDGEKYIFFNGNTHAARLFIFIWK
jgi:hypothetical protein